MTIDSKNMLAANWHFSLNDFDGHLHDIKTDWLNKEINCLIEDWPEENQNKELLSLNLSLKLNQVSWLDFEIQAEGRVNLKIFKTREADLQVW